MCAHESSMYWRIRKHAKIDKEDWKTTDNLDTSSTYVYSSEIIQEHCVSRRTSETKIMLIHNAVSLARPSTVYKNVEIQYVSKSIGREIARYAVHSPLVILYG